MKKLVLIAIIATATLTMSAAIKSTDYIVTDNGVTYFQKVRYSFQNVLIGVTETGSKVRISLDDINSYRKNGEVYKKNTLTINGEPCDKCEFMKLIKTRHGFSLYSFMCTNTAGGDVEKCMVYQADKFVLEVNDKNRLQMIDFFTKTYE